MEQFVPGRGPRPNGKHPTNRLCVGNTGCNPWNESFETQTDVGFPKAISVATTYTPGPATNCIVSLQTITKTTTLTDTGAQSKSTFTYDGFGNVTEQKDTDFAGQVARDVQTSYVSGSPYTDPSINLVHLVSEVKVLDGAGATYSDTKYFYDQYSASQTPLYNCPYVIGHDNPNFAGAGLLGATRGNVTQISAWLDTSNAWLNTYQSYSMCGNLMSVQDANGHATSFSYNDNFSDGAQRYSYGFLTAAQNALGQSTLVAAYDYGTGHPTMSVDLWGQTTSYSYGTSGFAIDRLSQTTYPNGGHTYYSYPSATLVITQQDQSQPVDRALQLQTWTDGLGRVIESDSSDGVGGTFAITQQKYDALGRTAAVSNPYHDGDTQQWTTFAYDSLGRRTKTTMPDSSFATTSYSGNQTTVTDQASHAKMYTFDSAGNLFNMVEDPGDSSHLRINTDYRYDPLGNRRLVSVGNCAACQQRQFFYDSLGRLTKAVNPESGAVTFTFDNAGNVLSRTDGRSMTTNNQYDALNRLTQTTYADGTPAAKFIYDGQGALSTGQLTSAFIGDGSSMRTDFTSFDVMGHVLKSSQTTAGTNYAFGYTYNLAGALLSETYPSGRTMTLTYDKANRPTDVSGVINHGAATNYASNVGYAAQGAPSGFTMGNGVAASYSYNNLLQLISSSANNSAGSLFSAVPNWLSNGTLQSVSVQAGGGAAVTTSFTYDAINRLTHVSDSGGYVRDFNYDQYANMWVTNAVGIPAAGPTSNVYSMKNQLSGLSYDAAGRLLSSGSTTFSYDANDQLIQAADAPGIGGGTVNYSFDALGERVQKQIVGGATTIFVYDAFGALAAEYSSVASAAPCATCYLTWDHLGSPRMVTDRSGAVVARHDYLPFGEEIGAGQAGRGSLWGKADGVEPKFTGQLRDCGDGQRLFQCAVLHVREWAVYESGSGECRRGSI